jgi:hypothetical protein
MSYIFSRLLAAVLLLGLLSTAAFADTKVKVKAKVKPPAEQKAEVKGITQTRIEGPAVAFGLDDKTITVKPLDAPDNPYVKVYSDWDRWVVSHARPDIRFSDLHWVDGRWVITDASGRDLEVSVARVNPEGYLLPLSDKSSVSTYVPVLPRAEAEGNYYYVIAAGAPEAKVRKVYVTERGKVLAPVVPKIPDWLIKQPAQRVVLAPKEYIVQRPDKVWVRYDENGKVLTTTKPGESWRVMYWPKFSDAVREASGKKLAVIDDNGYVVTRDASGRIVSVFDYDGTPLKLEDVKVTRQPYLYTPLDWDVVQSLRDAQVNVDVDKDGDGDTDVKIDVSKP